MLTEQRRSVGEVLRWCAVVLTAAAAAIHFAVTPEHFDEDRVIGVFFVAAAWGQLVWALLVVRADHRRLLVAGLAGNLAIVLVWAASRTAGLPVGPELGTREAVQFIDVLATALEIAAAATITIALRMRPLSLPKRTAAWIVAAVALVVIPLTSTAIATHDHGPSVHEKEQTHERPSHG